MGIGVGFSLQQLTEALRLRDANGRPYVLIGGQAVNYWAERYLSREPQLELLQPFTSEDIDFKGTSEDVKRIARQLDATPAYPRKVEMTALAGIIPCRIGDSKSSIEVVRRLPGVPGSVDELAIQAEWNGEIIRALDPVSLLACKLELAATLSQKQRQDVAHLRILLPCVRSFLEEFLEQVESGQLPARGWLGAANQVLKLTTTRRARKIAGEHQINWLEILPMAAIASSRNEKIRKFQKQQLEQSFWKSKRISG